MSRPDRGNILALKERIELSEACVRDDRNLGVVTSVRKTSSQFTWNSLLLSRYLQGQGEVQEVEGGAVDPIADILVPALGVPAQPLGVALEDASPDLPVSVQHLRGPHLA